jgi:adenosine kinase
MKILISGSVAYDYLMTFPGDFKEHILVDQLESISLSFLVDRMVKRRGGIAPNIAYTMALLGGNPQVFATVGEDFGEYRAWLEEHGVDTTYLTVVPDTFTASFFATTDKNNAQLASFYPGAMAHAALLTLNGLADKPDLVVVSPNDPAAMQKTIAECKALGIPYAYDPSQQIARADGDTLREGVDGALALFCNEYEFGLIKKKTELSDEAIFGHTAFTVITRGSKGASIHANDTVIEVEAFLTDRITDPTGAGDAFRGGFLTGFRLGWDWALCGKLGSLASTYCLEADGPQGHHYTTAEFIARFAAHYGADDRLNQLLG